MRNFLIVLKFELMSFMKNKTFLIATAIICLLLMVGLSLPTIRDTFFSSGGEINDGENIDDDFIEFNGSVTYGYINQNGAIPNPEDLQRGFGAGKLVEFHSKEELESKISSGEIKSGFLIETPNRYQHIVQNNEMYNSDSYFFDQAMITAYRINGFEQQGIDYSTVQNLIMVPMESDTVILGTDSAGNYLYTYILVFGLYFMIIIYGQLVAVSVASEKSNRAMEVLITSTNSSTLIFGKVIGGAIAGIIQFGAVILTAMLAYNLNATAWNNSLDFIFKIPVSVLLAFSSFGILGYLFYVFIFGALGALVSRTEDVNTSATPITILFVAVFAISVMGMQMTEGLLIKVASFVPFSSFMAMFVRVSMGTVSTIEVIISLSILAVTTALTGLLASKIYRMGTLMYGNPVKINTAIKMLFSK